MTLYRQLMVVIIILILVMLGNMFRISMASTRSFLNGQMQTQTRNAVDALVLRLRPLMAKKDIAMMDTLANAVFDHGYYRRLLLEDMKGQVILKRINPDPVRDVPEWFVHMLPLKAPQVSAIVTAGWRQFGKLTLEAHPGRAYINLWDSFRQLLALAALTFLIGILAVVLVVRGMLRPLAAIEAQAIAICKREFPLNDIRPWTREFRHVVEAMNRMTAKVRDMIATLSERADELQRQARVDKLTGLPNREGFMPAFIALLERREKSSSGLFVLIKLADFASFNDRVGYQVGDRLLQDIAGLLRDKCRAHAEAMAGRIGGVDFALAMPERNDAAARDYCAELARELRALQAQGAEECRVLIGATFFSGDDGVGDILGRADTSLSIARAGSADSVHLQNDENRALGNANWQQIIDDVLRDKRISLLAQPIHDTNGNRIYSELLARMHDADGALISPAEFMPMAERLHRIVEVDRVVMQQAIEWLRNHTSESLAVNISSRTLHEADFASWINRLLDEEDAPRGRLFVELTEHAALQDVAATASFIERLHQSGIQAVIERFGSGLASFGAIRELKADYIKLDGSYVRGISDDAQNRFFVQTLLDIAHGLDMRVIAEHVENEADKKTLVALRMDAVQGYLIGKPQPLAE